MFNDKILTEEGCEDFRVGILVRNGFKYVFTKEPRRPGTPGVRITEHVLPHEANVSAELASMKKQVTQVVYKRLRLVVGIIEDEKRV